MGITRIFGTQISEQTQPNPSDLCQQRTRPCSRTSLLKRACTACCGHSPRRGSRGFLSGQLQNPTRLFQLSVLGTASSFLKAQGGQAGSDTVHKSKFPRLEKPFFFFFFVGGVQLLFLTHEISLHSSPNLRETQQQNELLKN